MQKLEFSISIIHRDSTEQGRLLVAWDHDGWRAEIWQGAWLLTSFDHTSIRQHRAAANSGKRALLERVRVVAECVYGVHFDLDTEPGR